MNPSMFQTKTEPMPKGFNTAVGWAAKWKLSLVQTRRLIANGIKSKQIETRQLKLRISSGAVRSAPIFGLATTRRK